MIARDLLKNAPSNINWNQFASTARLTAMHRFVNCVEEVLHKCVVNGNKMLGLRFFIWAGQQQDYRLKHSSYNVVCRILGVMKRPKMLPQVLADMKKDGCGVH